MHPRNYGTISIAQLGHVLPFQFCDTYMTGTSWKVGSMLRNMIIVAFSFCLLHVLLEEYCSIHIELVVLGLLDDVVAEHHKVKSSPLR